MSVNFESFGIHQLSVPDRLELIEQIWNSLPDRMSADDVPDWQLAELARRRSQAALQPGQGRPWREVLGDLGNGA